METTIEPRTVSGFRDYLPEEMIPRQKILDTIRIVFERFGFVPLDTPCIEREEILTGGDPNFRMQIFTAATRSTRTEDLALRFDLTVPLARVIAAYPNEIKKPFKRYQTGKVWRGEKPQAGRYREFVQFDADIVGTRNIMADAEIVSLMFETMIALKIEDFCIRINNRKILNGLSEYAQFDIGKLNQVLRAIDKLDKQGWDGVKNELTSLESEDGVGLSENSASLILRFLELRNDEPDKILNAVAVLMVDSSQAQEGVFELRSMISHIEALGVPKERYRLDLSVARGLGYYTGPVFETILTKLPGIGSVFSGGRYDNLVARFSPISFPATSASVGVDRLFAAMEELNLLKKEPTQTKVLILNFDNECETYIENIAFRLRKKFIPTEIYFGTEKTIKAQLNYALKQSIPLVLIVGSDEMKNGLVTVKEMASRKQDSIPIDKVVDLVRENLL
ncbi:MAG: histidine--tRNA ligase [Nanoarchaeota archaeon]